MFTEASFIQSVIGETTVGADGSGNSISYGADFSGVKFGGPANFDLAGFETTAYFGWAEFEDIVFFDASTFSETAELDFLKTKFHRQFQFLEVYSHSVIDFSSCDFVDEADFRDSTLLGPMTLHRSKFQREARFGPISFQDGKERPLCVRFWEMDMPNVTFRRADLRGVTFYNSYNLDRAEFSACLWNKAHNRQSVLYDELALRGDKPIWGSEMGEAIVSSPPSVEEWERVENTYRDLRRNLENRKDYAAAGEFYVGEMEMRRLPKPWIQRHILSLEALYLHLSDYGENWWKSIGMLLFLLGISTLVYAGWPKNLDTLGISLMYSLSVFTLLRVSVGDPLHWTGQLMAIVQLVLSPILITLSVLAIRRKLKR